MTPKVKRLHHRWLSATPGTILSFGAVLCLFFVITGVPLNSKIFFLEVIWDSKYTGTGTTQTYTIGLWGWCFGLGSDAGCSVPDVGFELGDNADYFNFSPPHTTLGYLTVAHLVAFIMAIVITFMGGFAHCSANRKSSLLTWTAILSILTLLVTLFALIVDTILYRPRVTQTYESRVGPAFAPMGVSIALLVLAVGTFLLGQRIHDRRLEEKERSKNAKTNDKQEQHQQMDDRPSNSFQRDEEETHHDTWSDPEISAPTELSNSYTKYPEGRPLPSIPDEDKSMLTIPPYRSLAPFAPPPPSPNSGISSFDNLLERHDVRSSSLSSKQQPAVQTTKSKTKKSKSYSTTHSQPRKPHYPLASGQPVVQTTSFNAKRSYSTRNQPGNPLYQQSLLTSRFTLPAENHYNHSGSNLNNNNNNNSVDDVESVIDYYQNGSSPEGGFRRWI